MSFFVAKGITAVLKGGAEIMGHGLAHGELTGDNPDKRYHIDATRCHFREIPFRTVDSKLLCSKRNNNKKNKENKAKVYNERKTI